MRRSLRTAYEVGLIVLVGGIWYVCLSIGLIIHNVKLEYRRGHHPEMGLD